MRILLLTPNYPPDVAPPVRDLGEDVAAAGHEALCRGPVGER